MARYCGSLGLRDWAICCVRVEGTLGTGLCSGVVAVAVLSEGVTLWELARAFAAWTDICTFFGADDGRCGGSTGDCVVVGLITADLGFRIAAIGEAWNSLRPRDGTIAACLASREEA